MRTNHQKPKPRHASGTPPFVSRIPFSKWLCLLWLYVFCLASTQALAQPGFLDLSYPTETAPNDYVEALGDPHDGRILVAGRFTSAGGTNHSHLLRINVDGSTDSQFAAGSGPDSDILSFAIRADGRILIAGSFTQFNGTSRNRVALLSPDGALDPAFDAGAGPSQEVLAMLPLPGDSVLIGGAFTHLGESPRSFLARLKPNGTLDNSFLAGSSATTGPNGVVRALLAQSDGRILVAGDFTRMNGVPRNRVARLLPDGTLDATFEPGPGPDGSVQALALAPNGSLIIGGTFSAVAGASMANLARLNPDGSLDTLFDPGVNGPVSCVSVLGDGKVVIAGDFLIVDGQSRSRVARLRADGRVDLSFDPGAGCNGTVTAMATPLDGNVILGGRFSEVDNQPRPFIARLLGLSTAEGGELEFSSMSYSTSESQTTATLEVRRTGNSSSPVTVDYSTSNGTANAGDYLPQTGKLSFGPGETRKTFTVPIRQDAVVEDDETVNLSLSNPGGGAALGALRTAVLVILNDDATSYVGSVEPTFKATLNGNGYAIAPESAGSTIVAGAFTAVNGVSRLGIARILEEGALDATFQLAWFNAAPLALVIQTDGRILVGGQFTALNGNPQSHLARLQTDGSPDPTLNIGSGPAGDVYAMLELPTGDLIVGGQFQTVAGLPQAYLARLFSDGSLDTAFPVTVNGGAVHTLLLQPDGKVLFGGDFTTVNGLSRTRLARLNNDGTLDTGFDPGPGPNNTVSTLALQSDGGILVGGIFNYIDFTTIPYLARLFTDGTLDPGFRPGLNGEVRGLLVQSEDKIVVVGDFSTAGGAPRSRIARLSSDGVADPSFVVGNGFNAIANAVTACGEGDVVAVGNFTQFDGLNRAHIVHLLGISSATGGEIEFARPRFQAGETDAFASIEVRRNGFATTAVTVDYATSNGTANAGDYTAQSGKLSFAPGETRRTFQIPIRADSTVEDDETISLTLSNPTGGGRLGTYANATLTVLNDDVSATAGSADATFAGRIGSIAESLLPLPDGRFLAGGSFTEVDGRSRLFLARFQPDGGLDTSFSPGTWFDDTTHALAIQPDGKLIVGGQFSLVNGLPRNRVARLNIDGSLDLGFNPGAGPNGSLLTLLVLPSGDILAGGVFTVYGSTSQSSLARLYSDGTLDPTFKTKFSGGSVRTLLRQEDGRILVGGDFTQVDGLPRRRIARLEASGILDRDFNPGLGFDGSVHSIAVQADGQILVAGSFTTVDGKPTVGLARLDPMGHLDTSFDARFDGPVYSVVAQRENLVLAGGNFTQVLGQPCGRIVRLRMDGSVDASFDTGAGFNGSVRSLAVQSDGNLLVAGEFTQFNGLARSYLIRLLGSDNASGGSIEFSAASYSASESDPVVTIEVRRTGNTDSPVSVDFATSNGTATAGDYAAVSQHLTFGTAETRKTVTITIRPDTTVEDDETVLLTLSNPTGGATLGPRRTAPLVILNDDRFYGNGTLDTEFPAALDGVCLALAAQPDGRFVAAGNFLAANEVGHTRIARFAADGTLDPTFTGASWLNDFASAVAVQPDGHTLIGGRFTTVNDITRRRLARLAPDGTLDTAFDPLLGPNGDVLALVVVPNGKTLVGGNFSQFNGTSPGFLVRVFEDASLDTGFASAPNATVRAIEVLGDGRILIGGDFTKVNNIPRNRVARLLPDGSIDPTFDPGEGPNNTVLCVASQSDGRILIGGLFKAISGVALPYLGRLGATGQVDVTFNSQGTGLSGYPYAFHVQSDDRIVIGGAFTSYNGESHGGVVRLNANGTHDPTFSSGSGSDGHVNAIASQPDGALIIGGDFTHFNGLSAPYLARLHGYSVSKPIRFTGISVTGPGQLKLSLSTEPGQSYVLQLSEDLVNWVPFATNTAPAATFSVPVPATSSLAGEYFRAISVR